MAIPAFPQLVGLTYPISRSPLWSTIQQDSWSGKSAPIGVWSYPRRRYKLAYEFLRSAAGGFTEQETLEAFFHSVGGSRDAFSFTDVDDQSAVNVTFGLGDGVTNTFQLMRARGGFLEPVFLPRAGFTVAIGGQAATGLVIGGNPGLLTFSSAPAVGKPLTWTGGFDWLCRFDDDTLEFAKFMNGLWSLGIGVLHDGEAVKSVTDALRALLASGTFVLADLYTISLAGGGILRFTTADRDVTVSGQTWVSNGPLIDVGASGSSRSSKAVSHQKNGLDVDTRTVAILPRPVDPISGAAYPDRIGGQPFIRAVTAGALDGAEMQVDRAYWPSWPPLTGPMTAPTGILSAVFAGRVAGIALDRGVVNVTMNSHLELLTLQVPRNFYGPSCDHTLFDGACSLQAANYASAGTISGLTPTGFTSAIAAPKGSGTFTLGRVVFTSGSNAGAARMVRSWTAGTFSLIAPPPYPMQVGDGFTAYPGCDKQQSTCLKFNNLVNFGGTPFTPSKETAV